MYLYNFWFIIVMFDDESSINEFLARCYRVTGKKKVLMPNGEPLRLTFTCTERKWFRWDTERKWFTWGTYTFKQTVRKILRSKTRKGGYRLFIRISKKRLAEIAKQIPIPTDQLDSCRNWKLNIGHKTYSKDRRANMIISHNFTKVVDEYLQLERMANRKDLLRIINLDDIRML